MALPYTLVPLKHKTIGLIVLQADETLEGDMRRLLPDDVDILVSRVPSNTVVTSSNLVEMAQTLTGAVELFPLGMSFDAIGYGCTSGTAEIGIARIADLIQAGADALAITEPVSALIAACRVRRITRLGLISPYIAEVSDTLCGVLAMYGITVAAFASFEEVNERNVVRIAPASIHAAAVNLQGNFDAIFLSCTNLRTLDVLDQISAEIGKPVFSSNQVLAWHLQQLL